uniref:Uncharacterized protein n=1 Tax=Arundo donax TaxID=35708 RepID=A0A0A8XYW7_ARUDO
MRVRQMSFLNNYTKREHHDQGKMRWVIAPFRNPWSHTAIERSIALSQSVQQKRRQTIIAITSQPRQSHLTTNTRIRANQQSATRLTTRQIYVTKLLQDRSTL